MLLGVARRASGPKALPAPYAAGNSSGNLKLHVANKRVVMRWVARNSGTLSKLWIKTRALPTDGSSYTGGTAANWSWLAKHHPVDQATGLFDPATVLATETFNPNTRQNLDGGGQDLQTIGLVCGFPVIRGRMYATTIEPANAAPATDYASWNFLYNATGGEGAQTRNELNANVYDSFMGLDPRETIGGCNSDGSGQSYPANNFNYPGPFTKHVPTYIQVYADGTATGQPYYSGSPLSAGVVQTMNFRALRPSVFTHIGAFLAAADSFSATLKVNNITKATVTIASDGSQQNVRVLLPTPVAVAATDAVSIDFTPGSSSSVLAYYSDAQFANVMGSMTSSGPFYLSSNNVRVAGIFPLPWLPAYEPGFGASASYAGLRGTVNSSTASATQIITLTSGLAQNSRAIVIAGGRNSGATLLSASDNRGNTWTVDAQSQFALANGTLAIASGHVATALQAGDTVSLTWSAAVGPSNEASVHELSGILASTAVDKTATANSTSTSATLSVGPTADTTQPQEMVVAAFQSGGGISSWTPGNGYTALGGGILQTSGATSGDRSLMGCYLPVSFAGAQTAKGNISPSSSYNAVLATYKSS